jgi:hypothetical protein
METIKASELRIANWILFNQESYQIAIIYNNDRIGIKRKNGSIFYLKTSQVLPVQLTKDVLLKCGFIKHDIIYTFNGYAYFYGNISILQKDKNAHIAANILYLHELQNVFHSIDKLELEFKQ